MIAMTTSSSMSVKAEPRNDERTLLFMVTQKGYAHPELTSRLFMHAISFHDGPVLELDCSQIVPRAMLTRRTIRRVLNALKRTRRHLQRESGALPDVALARSASV